ncbi:hypothetical protein MCA1091 [Methylococcus capsulatus str. Bath]|uniref:Uncharacterized protein n=1 Tax=Methylococcus capsulatus (strain ATCC 33009 / NCIMB 11132 / Bath) TaxID=243233 RepID=Q609Y5_METCA|nr:hypothetical protein MCA1091 [Methylococcus capsulatus str. Bath]
MPDRPQRGQGGHRLGHGRVVLVELQLVNEAPSGIGIIRIGILRLVGFLGEQQGPPGRPGQAVQYLPVGAGRQQPGRAGFQVNHRKRTPGGPVQMGVLARIGFMGAVEVAACLRAGFVRDDKGRPVVELVDVQIGFIRDDALGIAVRNEPGYGVEDRLVGRGFGVGRRGNRVEVHCFGFASADVAAYCRSRYGGKDVSHQISPLLSFLAAFRCSQNEKRATVKWVG